MEGDAIRDRAGQKAVRPATTQAATTQTPASPPAVSTPPQKQVARSIETDNATAARVSAASVGLLDIDDTLLFGGAHGDLSAVDPYAMQIDDDKVYTLNYLLQRISAFTVAQLQNGFPYNADPKVTNSPSQPKYQAVLDIGSFELGSLDDVDKQAAQKSQIVQPNIRPDVSRLSAQVRALNAKVERLSKTLEQAVAS